MERIGSLIWGVVEFISLRCLKLLFKIIKKEVTKEIEDIFLQFIKFGIVGVSNTAVSYAINVVVLLMLATKNISWDYFIGNVVAFLLSVMWSFYWNNKYVFAKKEGQKRIVWKALLKTYASYALTGLVLNNILSWMWIDVFNISKYIAPVINLLMSVPLNFIMNKLWAFKTEK